MTTETLDPPAPATPSAAPPNAQAAARIAGRRDMRTALEAVIRARLAANPELDARDAGAVVADLVAEFPAHTPKKRVAL